MVTDDDSAYEDGRYRQCDHDGYPATSVEMVRGRAPRYEPAINWVAVSVTLIVVGTIVAMFICYIIT